MSTKLATVLNKLIGGGMLFLSAAFMSPYTSNGPGPVGIAFGLAGLWLVVRKTNEDGADTQLLTQKLERIETLLESQQEELEAAKVQISRLVEERSFVAQLSASHAESEVPVRR